jgi:hypothetical protein
MKFNNQNRIYVKFSKIVYVIYNNELNCEHLQSVGRSFDDQQSEDYGDAPFGKALLFFVQSVSNAKGIHQLTIRQGDTKNVVCHEQAKEAA